MIASKKPSSDKLIMPLLAWDVALFVKMRIAVKAVTSHVARSSVWMRLDNVSEASNLWIRLTG